MRDEYRRHYRPEWYFHSILVSWRLWAIGTYDAPRKNWRVRFVALGPLRFRFVRLEALREQGPDR